MVLGTRGPGAEGGIESHVDELVPLMCAQGWNVEVIGRAPYEPVEPADLGPARVTWLWAPKVHWLETIVHSFIGLAYAAIKRPDLLHIHAVGPALVTPFARLLGLRVVVTHHGFDYEREKWGGMARRIIKMGEVLGMRFANRRIVISQDIRNRIEAEYHKSSDLIHNGVPLPTPATTQEVLDELGLEPGRYILQVSRCVPEKRQVDLIDAFALSGLADKGWKLVLVGNLQMHTPYGKKLKSAADHTDGVVLAGFRKGQALKELFTHAGTFVLPSSHEGLPIVMLEALSFGLTCIASDIPSNLEINLPKHQYFHLGDVQELAAKLECATARPSTDCEVAARRQLVVERYDWKKIACATSGVYIEATG